MQLSPHFALEEFQHNDPIPPDCVEIFRALCIQLLEPARSFAGTPLVITSGYRSPAANAAAHGIQDSEHIATPRYCAADFYLENQAVRALFDWMRLDPHLPYHQLILEAGANGSSIIHVSINLDKPGVRSVLEGFVHNSAPYTIVDHVAFDANVNT